MARRKSNTGIPGLSFSWKRALGITQAKQKFARETGIPTSKAGLERKLGNMILKSLFGKKSNIMGIKPGPKRIAESTGKPDRRQRDNKETPRNISSLKPHKHKKGD